MRPTAEEALAEWARRVRENREQAERVREGQPGPDFYAPLATIFRADPRRQDDPVLEILRGLVQRTDTVLDIGAGGGRYALPLALKCQEVIAVEPSEAMRTVLRESMSEFSVPNVRVVDARWPAEAGEIKADIALIAHVGYDIEEIGPFLEAMERSARRLCVAVLQGQSPAAVAEPFWREIIGEERIPLPALPEFIALQMARGRLCEVQLSAREPVSHPHPEVPVAWLRTQLFTMPGSERDRRIEEAAKRLLTERNGRWAVTWDAQPVGVVTWEPPK
ncbi:MAG: class I SAM-dependent methyltransferase [Ignavibacteriales bacterium]